MKKMKKKMKKKYSIIISIILTIIFFIVSYHVGDYIVECEAPLFLVTGVGIITMLFSIMIASLVYTLINKIWQTK